MPDAASALRGATSSGYVTIEEVGPVGMITLRCDMADPALQAALQPLGLAVPGKRRIETSGGRSAAWMSPDEVLLILPYPDVQSTLASLHKALENIHFLAVDVSDARAVFRIRGDSTREVLAKLCPVDLAPAAFAAGEIRRTRAAQVAAAIWISADHEFTLVSFRSVAAYVFGILGASAAEGGKVGLF